MSRAFASDLGADHAAMLTRSLCHWIRRFRSRCRSERYSTHEWDREYTSNTWTYLTSLEQLPLYALIEGWRRQLKPAGRVLDLGCGEGVLFEHIPAERVPYVGVDLSEVAIHTARKKVPDGSLAQFICADFVRFEPPAGSLFDVIVFNEVLYYVDDPAAVVRRYRTAMAPNGLIIVSVFHRHLSVWKKVSASLACECQQEIVVHHSRSGKRWHLGLYQQHSQPP